MLKNDYLKKYGFMVFHCLDDYIKYMNKWEKSKNGKMFKMFSTKREIKTNNPQWEILSNGYKHYYDYTLNECINDFITTYLYVWNIKRNENITMLMYDDYIVVYTINQKHEYFFNEF